MHNICTKNNDAIYHAPDYVELLKAPHLLKALKCRPCIPPSRIEGIKQKSISVLQRKRAKEKPFCRRQKVSKRVKVRQKRAKGRFLRNGKICQAFAEKPKGLFVFSFFVIVGKQQQQPDDDACSDHDVKVLVVRIIVC